MPVGFHLILMYHIYRNVVDFDVGDANRPRGRGTAEYALETANIPKGSSRREKYTITEG